MNKKKILGSIAILTIAVTTMLSISFNEKSDGLSAISLANVEALATGEGGAGGSHTLNCGTAGIKMCKATCGIHQVTIENWGNGSPATFTCN
jgi:hypothetical protein